MGDVEDVAFTGHCTKCNKEVKVYIQFKDMYFINWIDVEPHTCKKEEHDI